MIKINKEGIAAVGAILLMVFLFAIVSIVFLRLSGVSPNNENQRTPGGREESFKDGPESLKIENIGVRFADYNSETQMAGDFRFDKGKYRREILDNRLFVEFGHKVDGNEGAKLIPEYTWHVPVGTVVISPMDGYIDRVGIIDWSGDYSISIKNSPNSQWMATLEHVVNVKVEEKDRVSAGQAIAEVSNVGSGVRRYGFAELSVWKGGATTKEIVKVCPYRAFKKDAAEEFQSELSKFVKDWEAFADSDIYDEEKWVLPGCLYSELTEEQAINPPPELY